MQQSLSKHSLPAVVQLQLNLLTHALANQIMHYLGNFYILHPKNVIYFILFFL